MGSARACAQAALCENKPSVPIFTQDFDEELLGKDEESLCNDEESAGKDEESLRKVEESQSSLSTPVSWTSAVVLYNILYCTLPDRVSVTVNSSVLDFRCPLLSFITSSIVRCLTVSASLSTPVSWTSAVVLYNILYCTLPDRVSVTVNSSVLDFRCPLLSFITSSIGGALGCGVCWGGGGQD
ncbi:hypothetical protein J6590_024718 [Homalodisca vitripennis]|nr:hypothetical protein J6590_024718 [Homalodisca vitripennis]